MVGDAPWYHLPASEHYPRVLAITQGDLVGRYVFRAVEQMEQENASDN